MNQADSYRAAIEAVDREVSVLLELERATVADGTTLGPLRSSWADLLGHLVPGPGPGRAGPGRLPARGTARAPPHLESFEDR
jgi:hypothetical protein